MSDMKITEVKGGRRRLKVDRSVVGNRHWCHLSLEKKNNHG